MVDRVNRRAFISLLSTACHDRKDREHLAIKLLQSIAEVYRDQKDQRLVRYFVCVSITKSPTQSKSSFLIWILFFAGIFIFGSVEFD